MTYHGFFSRLFICQTALAKGLIQQGIFAYEKTPYVLYDITGHIEFITEPRDFLSL